MNANSTPGHALSGTPQAVIAPYLARWRLTPDGPPLVTRSSILAPVRWGGTRAMLKVATEEEEERGANLLAWWDGRGAARVLAHAGAAIVMERAEDDHALDAMAHGGRDDEASRVLCATAAQLHAPRETEPPASLVPLSRWFAALVQAAQRDGGIFHRAAATAEALLATPQQVVPLHGDLHHGNVLHFGEQGWLAIDPKGLLGERGFDFANIFCNPDEQIATRPGRLARQATVVAAAAGLERSRLLRWIFAYAGLSAAWSLEDGDDPGLALAVAEIAAAEMARTG